MQAKHGDTVKVHYTGKFEDGTIFDTSVNDNPLQFKIGAGQIIQGFEEAVLGMGLGESKTTTIPADKAYGPYRKEMVVVVARNQFPENLILKVGEKLQLSQSDDQTIIVTIADASEATVTLDANHPLSGKDLTFDIQLVEIG